MFMKVDFILLSLVVPKSFGVVVRLIKSFLDFLSYALSDPKLAFVQFNLFFFLFFFEILFFCMKCSLHEIVGLILTG